MICDILINRRISWCAYVFASVIFAWTIATPMILVKADRIMYALGAFTIMIFPFIYTLSRITPVKDWFSVPALPIIITATAALWLTYIMFRFLKLGIWYLLSGVVILFGIIVSSVVQYSVSVYTGMRFITLGFVIDIIIFAVFAVLLVIIGRYSEMNKKNAVQSQKAGDLPEEQDKKDEH